MLRDLDKDPLWQADDLGKPVPDHPHAVSVALPLWEHVIGYEEGDPAVLTKFQAGYPRFFVHPKVEALFSAAKNELARNGENVLVFPDEKAAGRCGDYLDGENTRVAPFRDSELHAICFPENAMERARFFWRICGDIVSSRQSDAALAGTLSKIQSEGDAARKCLLDRLSKLSGQAANDVFLFPSGMSAVASLHRALCSIRPGLKCVQLDFPYVDVLKVQEQIGAGVVFLGRGDEADLTELEDRLESGGVSGIYCEFPSNPLLRSVDLERVSRASRAAGVPLIVDDTIASVVNVDVYPFADAVTTSLTKYFSGTGNVMAGCVILNRDSPHHDAFSDALEENAVSLWDGDAIVLETNSRDFGERIQRINANAERAYHHFCGQPGIAGVYYPLSQTPELFIQAKRRGAGCGGLLSIVHENPDDAVAFYDSLRVSKGPSLGTNFSLACPYTLLAHYTELDWAAKCGVPRHLIRISVGVNGFPEV